MARRRGLIATLAQIQRETARAEAARRRAESASRRQAEQARLRYTRAVAADERERKRLYAESRVAEVEAMNAEFAETVTALDGVLAATLDVDNYFDLDQLYRPAHPGQLAFAEPPPEEAAFLPPPPKGVSRMMGGAARHEEEVRAGRARFQQACAEHAQREHTRRAALAQLESDDHRRAGEVTALKRAVATGAPDAVVTYVDLVLTASLYPDAFPQHWRLAYVPESRQLVVEYDLPGIDAVPTVKAYRYVKTSDTVTETLRPQTQVKAQYASVIAQTALRVVDEIFEADRWCHIDTIVLNGMVSTNDPATGRAIRPCLLTLRTTRETFAELDLRRVDPAACLRHLGAGVSRKPEELAPVRPVLEFDMADPRFIEESDIIGGLDERPNLLAMSPTEFEGLIQNLFTRMGLDTRQTRASRDGGVDCVAVDPRPIMGGKVVIQAKRYRHTVGVAAVRDLYGTLQNEGASKGILVTTSGYGKASHDFANGKHPSNSSTAPTCSTSCVNTQASKPASKPPTTGATPNPTAHPCATSSPPPHQPECHCAPARTSPSTMPRSPSPSAGAPAPTTSTRPRSCSTEADGSDPTPISSSTTSPLPPTAPSGTPQLFPVRRPLRRRSTSHSTASPSISIES